MSVGREASTRVWITGYLGGAFFFKTSSSARSAFTFAWDSPVSVRSNALSWSVATFFFNRSAAALTNAVIAFSLAAIAA